VPSAAAAAPEATHEIARFVVDLRLEDLPERALSQAKLAILDTFGVTLAGSQHQVGRIIQEYVRQSAPDGPCQLFGADQSTSPEYAALANGLAAHALDYDDRGHASTHTLPVGLALGELIDGSGADLLLAYIAGREVRLQMNEEFDKGRFEQSGPGSRGWHATGTLGTVGATASAAKMLGLDVETTCTAFGISGSLLSGIAANWGTMTKPLHAGNSARNGVVAGLLARGGFTGEPTVFSAHWGVVDALCLPGECDIDNVIKSMRQGLHLVKHGVRIKPYPSCSGTHAYAEAAHKLRQHPEFRVDRVASIEVTWNGPIFRLYPRTPLECKFSSGYMAVVMLLEGTFAERHCTEEFLNRDEVQALMARVTYIGERLIHHDEVLRVTLTSGVVLEEPVVHLRDLTTYPEVQGKFMDNAVPVIGPAKAAELERLVSQLESVPSVRSLGQLLA
jgi:2-methylcitrate dehydratase PrpD